MTQVPAAGERPAGFPGARLGTPAGVFAGGGAGRLGRVFPEWLLCAMCLCAWVAMAAWPGMATGAHLHPRSGVVATTHDHGGHPLDGHRPGGPAMPGMEVGPVDSSGHGAGSSVGDVTLAALPMWAVMCVAMMLPAALPAARHVARRSLRRRRQRSLVAFAAGFLIVWVAVGPLAMVTVEAGRRLVGPRVVLLALVVAAVAWQERPLQTRLRRACHRTVPLRMTGAAATVSCLRFGVRHGTACVGVCGPVALLMAFTVHGPLLAMALLAGLATFAKLAPRRLRRRVWRPQLSPARSAAPSRPPA